MTLDSYWTCQGCGGLVHQDYLFTHVAFHERSGTSAEFKRPDE